MANYKTGAERRNDRMHKIFETAYELAAHNAGWSPTGTHGKWVCAGDKHFAKGSYMPTDRACRYICEDHNLLGLRSHDSSDAAPSDPAPHMPIGLID